MKKYVAIGIVACGLLIALGGFLPVRYDSPYDVEGFARLPILTGGRLKPIDSAARNSLLIIRDKQTFKNQAGEKKSAAEWFLDVTLRPESADNYKVFRIHNPDVIDLLGSTKKEAAQRFLARFWSTIAVLPMKHAHSNAEDTILLMSKHVIRPLTTTTPGMCLFTPTNTLLLSTLKRPLVEQQSNPSSFWS